MRGPNRASRAWRSRRRASSRRSSKRISDGKDHGVVSQVIALPEWSPLQVDVARPTGLGLRPVALDSYLDLPRAVGQASAGFQARRSRAFGEVPTSREVRLLGARTHPRDFDVADVASGVTELEHDVPLARELPLDHRIRAEPGGDEQERREAAPRVFGEHARAPLSFYRRVLPDL